MPIYYNVTGVSSADSYITYIFLDFVDKRLYVVGGVEWEEVGGSKVYRLAFDSFAGDFSNTVQSDFNVDHLVLDGIFGDRKGFIIYGHDVTGVYHYYSIGESGGVSTGSSTSFSVSSTSYTISGSPGSTVDVNVNWYEFFTRNTYSCSFSVTWDGGWLFAYYQDSYVSPVSGTGYNYLAVAVGGRDGGYMTAGNNSGYYRCVSISGCDCVAGHGTESAWLVDRASGTIYKVHPTSVESATVDLEVTWPDGVTLGADSIWYVTDAQIGDKKYVVIVYRTGEGRYRIAMRPVDEILGGARPLAACIEGTCEFYTVLNGFYENDERFRANGELYIGSGLAQG